jgi:hypothetical protein
MGNAAIKQNIIRGSNQSKSEHRRRDLRKDPAFHQSLGTPEIYRIDRISFTGACGMPGSYSEPTSTASWRPINLPSQPPSFPSHTVLPEISTLSPGKTITYLADDMPSCLPGLRCKTIPYFQKHDGILSNINMPKYKPAALAPRSRRPPRN